MLYGSMTVQYIGRATSIIGPANLMLIRKPDGSVLIHGGDLTTPRNYMSPGAELNVDDNVLIFIRKSEKILVTIHSTIFCNEILDWSTDKIVISRTEKELQDKLILSPKQYFNIVPKDVFREYQVEDGKIDILLIEYQSLTGLNGSKVHNVEVKRNKVTVTDCYQVLRYSNNLLDLGANVINWIAAPNISSNAERFCHKNNIKYVYVDFDNDPNTA